MTGSLARPAAAGQDLPATPALLPSGYLLAALALLLAALPALAGWLAGLDRHRGQPEHDPGGELARLVDGLVAALARQPPARPELRTIRL